MAGERTLPGLGLTGFWDLGDNTYKPAMDANLRLLSVVAPGVVDSRQASAPGTPSDGDIVIASTDWGTTVTDQSIQVRDDGAWVEIVPVEGWKFYDAATDELLIYGGAAWGVFSSGGGGSSAMVQSEITADHTVVDGDLTGNVVRRVNKATAISITVDTGLVGTEPATFIQTGAGAVSFVAGTGVTINSADARLNLRAKFSSASLIPDADTADTYYLIGDLDT